MAEPKDLDVEMEDDYDEEADSDFEGGDADEEIVSSSSDEEEEAAQTTTGRRPPKRRKVAKPKTVKEEVVELDSGDEATIKEREKDLKKQRKRGEEVDDDVNTQEQGWRAKTRSMRDKDKEEKKKSRLATVKGSTIDVNKIWEDMNRSTPLPPPKIEVLESVDTDTARSKQPTALQAPTTSDENFSEEMITIKRTYKFAGEVHTEEKVVPNASAEARLWLSQQSFQAQSGSNATVRRPLRRISRFDPNHANLAAFQKNWSKTSGNPGKAGFDAPKLNTVEKSKQDWAAHVDQEGLQEELEEASKAKGGYLGRQDFLKDVEQKREEEARAARLKSRGITSRSSSLAGTRSSDDNSYFGRLPRASYPDTSFDEQTLAQSTTSSSRSQKYGHGVAPTASARTISQSLPPSPLDNIPSKLYDRFPRFSMTTENSQPELSIADVTSTRFSIDEEGILAVPWSNSHDHQKSKRTGKIHRTIRKAISRQTIILKKAKVGVRRVPGTWRQVKESKDSDRLSAVLPGDKPAEDLVSETAPVLPAIPSQAEELYLKPDAEGDPFVIRASVRETAYRPVSKLSALEEHRASLDSNQGTPRPATSTTIKPRREPVTHFPPTITRYKFPTASFTPHTSTTTVNSYHTALERPPLRRPSPLARKSRNMRRSASYESIAANRFHPVLFPSERMGSSSNRSSRHNSLVSLNQTIAAKPYYSYSRPASARSDDFQAPRLQREPLFMDIPSQSKNDVSFVFQQKPDAFTTRLSLSHLHSRARSVHSFSSTVDRPVIIRSASVVQGSLMDQSHRKVPLFVPARIEKYREEEEEPLQLNGRRDSGMSSTDDIGHGSDRLRTKKSEVSNWSMTYQDGAVERISVDLSSDVATIRPHKRRPLKQLIDHFSSGSPHDEAKRWKRRR